MLIQVAAAGINNTDINTRIGWYSKKVDAATEQGGASGFAQVDDADATWSGVAMQFPRIQGADVCGRIVAVGRNVDPARIGERVIVRNMLRSYVDYRPYECWTFGSEIDGVLLSSPWPLRVRRWPCVAIGPMPSLPLFPAPTRRLKTCCTGLASGPSAC
ncbi:alcohol dehydrogenase catalytic domain-containing protein [Gemmobacter lanyuensis]